MLLWVKWPVIHNFSSIYFRTGVLMGCGKREQSTLASRLAMEFKLLRLIEKRRLREKKPDLGRGLEELIIRRNLAELGG